MNRKTILYAAFTFSLLATAGSLFLSEFLHWIPCVLCWYQRIFLYPLVIIFGVAIVKEITNLEYLVFPMALLGGCVALYHSLLQYKIIPENLGPCVAGASCTTPYHFGLEFITIPLLSLITFTIIGSLMYCYRKASV